MKYIFIFFFLLSSSLQAADRYWVGASSDHWSCRNCWAATNGGIPSLPPPTISDRAIFTVLSMGDCQVDQDSAFECTSFNTTGYIHTVHFEAGATIDVHADYTLSSSFLSSITGTDSTNFFIFKGASNILMNGGACSVSFRINDGATVTPMANITTQGNAGIFMTGGILDNSGNWAINVGGFSANYDTAITVNFGAATWTMRSSDGGFLAYPWQIYNPSAVGTITLNFDAATIIAMTATGNSTFVGGGQMYPRVQFNCTGGGNLRVYDSNIIDTFEDLENATAHSLKFEDGSTQYIVVAFTVTGSAGQLITLNDMAGSGFALDNFSGAPYCNDYLNITNSAGTDEVWYGGCHSVDGGGNTGWVFNNCGSSCAVMRSFGIIIN